MVPNKLIKGLVPIKNENVYYDVTRWNTFIVKPVRVYMLHNIYLYFGNLLLPIQ